MTSAIMQGVAAAGVGHAAEADVPPLGCDRDAVKLFIGNIPKNFTEAQLVALFETVGPVIELVIVKDKQTRKSKGSAFLWYQTRELAQQAIIHLNLRHTLPSADGTQAHPLVVRQAVNKPHAHGMINAPGTSRPRFCLTRMQAAMCKPQPALPRANMMQANADIRRNDQVLSPLGSPLCSAPGSVDSTSLSGDFDHALFCSPASLDRLSCGQHVEGCVDVPLMMSAANNGSMSNGLGYAGAAASRALQVPAQKYLGNTVSMLLNSQQMTKVEQHLHSIQMVSGACLNIMAQGPGIFCLTASGAQQQAEVALALLGILAGC